MTYKIGILIPSTTNGLKCQSYKDTHFYTIFLKSFVKMRDMEWKRRKIMYTIYLVIDDDDVIYSDKSNIEKLVNFIKLLENVNIKFISSKDIEKGWVTKMWNRAFKLAYDDGCDYFYQCGDDIEFLDNGCFKHSIEVMEYHNNIGVTGPIDWGRESYRIETGYNTKFILTQSFVSRKHMDFFGFYFPPEIKNWFCDDWITYVYAKKNKCFQMKRRILNKGGNPRYTPEGKGADMPKMIKKCNDLINKYSSKII